MNKKELIRQASNLMHEKGIRKTVPAMRHKFRIVDEGGMSRNFVITDNSRNIPFSADDVETVIDTVLLVAMEALKRGEPVTVHGFGQLKLKYHAPRKVTKFDTDEQYDVAARYLPKFTAGRDLKECAKVYEATLEDINKIQLPLPYVDEEFDEDGDE